MHEQFEWKEKIVSLNWFDANFKSTGRLLLVLSTPLLICLYVVHLYSNLVHSILSPVGTALEVVPEIGPELES